MTDEAKPVKPVKVFYSYAHEDKDWREKLAKCLTPLKRRGLITDWYDRCILPGSEWQNELDQHLETAQLILLLISPDFIASDYCYEVEMKRALEKHDAGEARVIPIILRHTDLEELPFQKLEGLPTKQRPITDWPDSDVAFRDIAQGIRRVIRELRKQPALGVPTAELRKCYLQIMADEWNTLRLQTLDSNVSDTRSNPVALEQVYVALNTTPYRGSALSALCYVEQRGTEQEWAEQLGSPIRIGLIHQERWRTKQGIVLLGQPGSGKSTFARYVSLILARTLLNPDTLDLKKCLPDWTGPALLPVIIPLGRLAANLAGDGAEDVAAAIRAHITTYRDLAGYGQALLTELRKIGGLVVFDGLDEVPGAAL